MTSIRNLISPIFMLDYKPKILYLEMISVARYGIIETINSYRFPETKGKS